ncbi:MAG TPA: extracellular solute-binding protein [Bacillota bacterium]|nr:extracellular solute-binding protein [Bacillota bacterium]
MLNRLFLLLTITGVALATLSGCTPRTETKAGELVVYSARNESFVLPLISAFEAKTGIQVRLLTGNETLVNKILEERNNVQADVFLSNDVGALEYLRLSEALTTNQSVALNVIDPAFRADDGSWVGLSARTRVLIYNKDMISEAEMPQTLWELTDPKWAGQFMITRGGNGSMVAHVAALRAVWGDDKTVEWIRAVRQNAGAVVNGHGDIRRAVGAGEYAFGLVNNYYFHQQLSETTNNNVAAVYPDQGKQGIGAFVNAAGIGLIKGGPNYDNAVALIDFLLEPDQQRAFAYTSMEVPLNPSVESNPIARPISDYTTMAVRLQDIGAMWADAKALIERGGLDLDLGQ